MKDLIIKRHSDPNGSGGNTNSEKPKYENAFSVIKAIKTGRKGGDGLMDKVSKKLVETISSEREAQMYDALKRAYTRYLELEKAVEKIKPDFEIFDENGNPTMKGYTKTQAGLLKQAKKERDDFMKAFNDAVDPANPNIDKIEELTKNVSEKKAS